jgi:hypothetical protein
MIPAYRNRRVSNLRRATRRIPMPIVWAGIWFVIGICLGSLTGCAASHPPAPDCAELRDVFHPATNETDRCPVTFADVETRYRDALERLEGCPGYLFAWCSPIDAPIPAPESAAWAGEAWAGVETCRDLYWTRGAYCHAIDEGSISP